MGNTTIISIGPGGLPQQNFNGKTYKLYKGERYFSRGRKRMHVAVWEFYNGPVPEGYHVHHVNENKWDNTPGNLTIKQGSEHNSEHSKKHCSENPEWVKEFQQAGIKKAPEWHKSDEGREWHSRHAKTSTAHVHSIAIESVCECCGNPFLTSIIRKDVQRFCSNKCKSKWRRKNGLDNIEKNCVYCGESFMTNKFRSGKYCSKSCSKKK